MPLTIQQLNADTTFLLTLAIPFCTTVSQEHDPSTDFTILVDPWLTGSSPIFHSSFAVSRHTTESAIQSLKELEKPPDLVIISQPKNDHCNRETLSTLLNSWKGSIIAVPAAAKKIRSWRHFEDRQIRALPAYNAKGPSTLIKIPIRTKSDNDAHGEITIANLPEPYDLSAVHNAIGITYHPPGPATRSTKPFSILYTPHGLTPALLEPYLTHHLHPSGAYPVDLLFHSLNVEANPKLMGGVVSNGAPGGVAIAKMVGARTWVGAHDEEKENGGIATRWIRCRVFGVREAEGMLEGEGVETTVRRLGVGGVFRLEEEGAVGLASDGFDGMSTGRAFSGGHG